MRYRVFGLMPIPPLGQTRRYTPHGPVVSWDRKNGLALTCDWAGNDQAITMSGLLAMVRA
jgi:acyl-homoserine lactone acylase PvdQ